MKRSSPTSIIAILLLAFSVVIQQAHAQIDRSSAKIELILVAASNQDRGVDKALKPYAGNLKRLFRFDSYQQISRSTATLQLPGQADVQLPQGNRLKIDASATANGITADLNWSAGIHARLNLKPGTPAVLGGPRIKGSDSTYLLIVKLR